MKLTDEQLKLREQYVLALIESTYPLQKETTDREVTLELLIQAAKLLQGHLTKELESFRAELAE